MCASRNTRLFCICLHSYLNMALEVFDIPVHARKWFWNELRKISIASLHNWSVGRLPGRQAGRLADLWFVYTSELWIHIDAVTTRYIMTWCCPSSWKRCAALRLVLFVPVGNCGNIIPSLLVSLAAIKNMSIRIRRKNNFVKQFLRCSWVGMWNVPCVECERIEEKQPKFNWRHHSA